MPDGAADLRASARVPFLFYLATTRFAPGRNALPNAPSLAGLWPSGLDSGLFVPNASSLEQAQRRKPAERLVSLHPPTGQDFACPVHALRLALQGRELPRVHRLLSAWQQRQKQKPARRA